MIDKGMESYNCTRVFFGDYRDYEYYSSYDLINETFNPIKSTPIKENLNRKISIKHKRFNDSRELLEFLNIDYSQQLSYIAGLCKSTPFIDYCLDEANFDMRPNHVGYCICIECPKYKLTYKKTNFESETSTLSNQKIDNSQISEMVVIIMYLEENSQNTIEEISFRIEKFAIDYDYNFHQKSFECLCFDNETKEIIDLYKLKEKISSIRYESYYSERKYGKIELNLSSSVVSTKLDEHKNTIKKVQKVEKYINSSLHRFFNKNSYLDNESENCYSELKTIKDNFSERLKQAIIRMRKEKHHEFDVKSDLGLKKDVENKLKECEEKLKWIEFFEWHGIKYFQKNETPKFEDRDIVFFYNEKEKEKNINKWNIFIGTLTTLSIKQLKNVLVYNLDLLIKKSKILPEKMGIYEFIDGEFTKFEFKYSDYSKYHYDDEQIQSDQLTEDELSQSEDLDDSKTHKHDEIQDENKDSDENVKDKKESNEFIRNQVLEDEKRNKLDNSKEEDMEQDIGNSDSHENIRNDDIVILLLGESGVGKSTFINAFFNYIRFRSLEDAEDAKEIIHKIGSKFTYTDENYKVCTVNLGDDDTNECDFVGQSSTQNAKAHEIKLYNGRILRIIDTPGMGDTRGIKVDQENFRNTVEYISQFPYLNGICFLVKPNNARFGPIFKYCFKELFSNLHKNATKNIFFCFTNSRSTSYRPGDTLPALNNFLQEIKDTSNVDIETSYENIFCFDNESFRYLIITKNGLMDPTPNERLAFKRSWEKSSSEAYRLLDSLDTKPVLEIKNIVVVNKSKSFLIDWSVEIINVLSDLIKSKQRVLSSRVSENIDKKEVDNCVTQIDEKISKITNTMAFITAYLQQNSVAVFNDNFYAVLSQHISECEKTEYILKTVDPALDILKEIRSDYKMQVNKKNNQIIKESKYDKLVHELMNSTIKDSIELCKQIKDAISNI